MSQINTSIQTTEQHDSALSRPGQWSSADREELRRTIGNKLTPAQFGLFCQVIGRTQLDPFSKQIYAVERQGAMTIQVGIDGFRLIAQRSGEYAGQVGPEWCGADGVWQSVWLGNVAPSAARVGVLRKGFTHPVWGVVTLAEYKATGPMWTKMPANQLAKCAESQALRKAFPAELSGLYESTEMDQSSNGGSSQPEVGARPSVQDRLRKPVENVVLPVEIIDQPPAVGDEVSPFEGDVGVELRQWRQVDCSKLEAWKVACEEAAQAANITPGKMTETLNGFAAKAGHESFMQFTVPQREKALSRLREMA